MNNTTPSIHIHNAQLRATARRFLTVLQNTQDLRKIDYFTNAEIILVGGLAVTVHTHHRITEDIDFAIFPPTMAKRIKETLRKHRVDAFERGTEALLFRIPGRQSIQLDLIPINDLPYRLDGMEPILSASPRAIPTATPLDLMCLKAFCCELHALEAKSQKRCL